MVSTLHDVARVAGVSIKTVSNVVNDYPHVRAADPRARALAIAELDYRPNLSARGLRSGRTGVIGLAIPELRQNYFAELADAIIRAAERTTLGVVIDQTGATREGELAVLSGKRLRLTDGILFSPERLGQEDIELLNVAFPLVLLGERMFGGPTDHVTMHNVESARAATEHLIGIGRRRIARHRRAPGQPGRHPSRPTCASAATARRSRRPACRYDPALVRVAAPWHRENGAAAMRALLDGGRHVRRGLRPQRHPRPRCTARPRRGRDARPRGRRGHGLRQHRRGPVLGAVAVERRPGREEIARLAVDLLLERINEKGEPQPPRQVLADFHIVGRESTGFAQPPEPASAVTLVEDD